MATKNPTTIVAEPGKQETFITREFEAPRELVFKAFTDPKLVSKWLGPRDLKMKIDKYETKNGGNYRYIHADGQGNEYSFRGVFHEVKAPERYIQTFEFEGLPESGHVCLETVTFEALPGDRTKLTYHTVFQSVADRDAMMQSGMENGVLQSHERLDELFEQELVK